MGRDRAAYMREYRARKKTIARAREIEAEWRAGGWDGSEAGAELRYTEFLKGRVAELEEEVRHLKAELSTRPPEFVPSSNPILAAMGLDEEGNPPGIRFNSRPFTPVPKKR